MKDIKEKEIIKELFKERFGLVLSDVEESQVKSPDFEFLEEGKRRFVAELKTIISVPPSEETGYEKTSTGSWMRKDNSPSRISRLIDNAYKQLKDYPEPKVLIFFDKTGGLGIFDLETALTEKMDFKGPDGSIKTFLTPHKNALEINEAKNTIDLYVWVEEPAHKNEYKYKIQFMCYKDGGKEFCDKFFIKAAN